MSENQYSTEGRIGECKPLIDACTPLVYRHNAFRITGLFSDASVRDIKRRVDDLKHAEEIGDAEEEHCHAFALKPPPSLEHIREAALRLQDPERRIVEEFFWFWPMEWGTGKRDPALKALANGDKKSPHEMWIEELGSSASEKSVICKHNLAVLYQMTALDGEHLNLKKTLTEDSLNRIEKYWRKSFEWWESLTDDEHFWGLMTQRIRLLDDPRLTTGFVRRMRVTLPDALDKINAMLAIQYIQKGNFDSAKSHIAFMHETHQGLDNTAKTLSDVTGPLNARLHAAIEKAEEIARQKPDSADSAAEELVTIAQDIVPILEVLYPANSYQILDACDAIFTTCLMCVNNHTRETDAWDSSISILDALIPFAKVEEAKIKLIEVRRHAKLQKELSHPKIEELFELIHKTDNLNLLAKINAIYSHAPILLSEIESACGRSSGAYEHSADLVARKLREIAVELYNQVDQSRPTDAGIKMLALSLFIHDRASSLACGVEMQNRFQEDESTLREFRNALRTQGTDRSLKQRLIREGLLPLWGNTEIEPPPLPVRPESSGKGMLITIAIAVIMLVIYGLSQNDSGSSNASRQTPSYNYQNTVSSPRSSLTNQIEEGKTRAKQMEARIQSWDAQLDRMERELNTYQASRRTSEYNQLLPSFNSLVDQRNTLYEQYEKQIDDINAMVNRYNSGVR
jgi:hypothetical protein